MQFRLEISMLTFSRFLYIKIVNKKLLTDLDNRGKMFASKTAVAGILYRVVKHAREGFTIKVN